MTSPPSISEQFVMDLVEKVRESSALTANELKELTIALRSLVDAYNSENRIVDRNHSELKEMIREVKDTTKKISKAVRTMIITVVVAFTLMTATYLFVKSSIDHTLLKADNKIEELVHQKVERHLSDHIPPGP